MDATTRIEKQILAVLKAAGQSSNAEYRAAAEVWEKRVETVQKRRLAKVPAATTATTEDSAQ